MDDRMLKELLESRMRMATPLTRGAMLRGALGTILGIGALGSLAACGSGDEESATTAAVGSDAAASTASEAAATTQAPAGEVGGTLQYIGWEGYDNPDVAKPFTDQYGVTIKSTYTGNGDETLVKLEQGGAGIYDVVTANKDNLLSILPRGVLQPLDAQRLPNVSVFPAFENTPWTTYEGQLYTIPGVWGDEPVVYRPDKWTEIPAKYTDFADPKYKGALTTLDDPYSNIWLFSKSVFPEKDQPSRLTQEELDQVVDAMLEVKPNFVTIGATFGDVADLLIRGDASIALDGWSAFLVWAEEKDVTLAYANPSVDGSFLWSDGYGIATDAPNVDTAYAFIDWMTAPAQNAKIADALTSASTSPEGADMQDPAVQKLYDFGLVEASGGLIAIPVTPPLEDEGDIVGQAAFRKAWEDFKLA
jgi:spermidine/putrescine transport system substrate-binding protein